MAGIIRPARRPPGWVAPGPAPRGAGGVALGPDDGEDLCHLAGDWRIFQRIGGHRWSLDDLVTAWFATAIAPVPPARVMDLGCGIGSVLLLLAWRYPDARLVGVEAQSVSVDLARRSLAWNGVEARCAVRLGDLRDPGVAAEPSTFDLVTATPPYLRPGTATESRRTQWGPCHFEHRGGLEEYCAAASRLLAPDGRFVTCTAAGDVERLRRAGERSGLAVERRRDVIPRLGKAALFSVHALGRAKAAQPIVDPPLVVRDARGRRTGDFQALRRTMGMPP